MELEKKVNRILEENGIEVDEKGVLLNVDSMSFISSIVCIEQEFNI